VSGKQMKRLRRLAEDLVPVEAPDRDIVAHPTSDTTAFNSPRSLRGATKALKKQFNKRRFGA
jgi:hypothetical protein